MTVKQGASSGEVEEVEGELACSETCHLNTVLSCLVLVAQHSDRHGQAGDVGYGGDEFVCL